jgi:hypothetical protein
MANPPAPDAASAPLFGDVLVVMAQGFAALQFILEEKFLAKYRVPALLAVGLEGFWGMVICAIALPILTTQKDGAGLPYDDALGAFREIQGSQQLQIAVGGSIVSIAFFNFFGISVTKSLSGAARATIDACRWVLLLMQAAARASVRCPHLAASCCDACSIGKCSSPLQAVQYMAMPVAPAAALPHQRSNDHTSSLLPLHE